MTFCRAQRVHLRFFFSPPRAGLVALAFSYFSLQAAIGAANFLTLDFFSHAEGSVFLDRSRAIPWFGRVFANLSYSVSFRTGSTASLSPSSRLKPAFWKSRLGGVRGGLPAFFTH